MTDALGGNATTQRVNYFEGQYLDVEDFRDEQRYHLAAARRLPWGLQMTGIVRGLDLVAGEDPDRGVFATVTPGFAIDGLGRSLVVAEPLTFVPTEEQNLLYLVGRGPQDEESTEPRWDEAPELLGVTPAGSPPPGAICVGRVQLIRETLDVRLECAQIAGLTIPERLWFYGARMGVEQPTANPSRGYSVGYQSKDERLGDSARTKQQGTEGLHFRTLEAGDPWKQGTRESTRFLLGADGDSYIFDRFWVANELNLQMGGTGDKWWRFSGVGQTGIMQDGKQFAQVTPTDPSDRRLKTVEGPIADAAGKVARLNGVSFRWNDAGRAHLTRNVAANLTAGPGSTEEETERLRAAERERAAERLTGPRIGLIAQDVAAVCPELVEADEEGYLSVDYPHLVALLVEAVKEQQAAIAELRAALAAAPHT